MELFTWRRTLLKKIFLITTIIIVTLFALTIPRGVDQEGAIITNSDPENLKIQADPNIFIFENGDFSGYPGFGNETHPYILENYIIDAKITNIKNPKQLELELNGIPGVIENGLFIGMADIVYIGSEKETIKLKR